MKLILFAIAPITIAVLLIPIILADSATSQDCLVEEGLPICLNDRYGEINRIYREVLGRNADYRGLRTWFRELERGRSLRDIRHTLAQSREASEVINQIYVEVLGRNADIDSLERWTRQLRKGRTLEEVKRAIERSPEAREGGYWRSN